MIPHLLKMRILALLTRSVQIQIPHSALMASVKRVGQVVKERVIAFHQLSAMNMLIVIRINVLEVFVLLREVLATMRMIAKRLMMLVIRLIMCVCREIQVLGFCKGAAIRQVTIVRMYRPGRAKISFNKLLLRLPPRVQLRLCHLLPLLHQ
jgi:hypothetical protein